ncbi:MAG TPA: DUF309 domain-containing protein [Dissulfurispiraceae bacterium]
MTTGRENFIKGAECFNRGEYFEAHEAWERFWKDLDRSAERDFIQGLIMVAAALHHYKRGEHTGAARLLGKGVKKMRGAPGAKIGMDKEAFMKAAALFYERLASSDSPIAFEEFPKIKGLESARTHLY